jgi:hypothetical protein
VAFHYVFEKPRVLQMQCIYLCNLRLCSRLMHLYKLNNDTSFLGTRIRRYQQYALTCTTPLFYVLAPSCFGSSLPASGSFLYRSELPEIQIGQVIYNVWLRDLCAGLSWFRMEH